MKAPTIGDSVHYTDPLRRTCAAIVTNLDGPLRVRLAVFPPNGSLEFVWALRYDPDTNGPDFWKAHPTVGYWNPR